MTYSSSTTLSLSSVWPSWYLEIYTLLKTEICIHLEKVRVAPRCDNRMGTITISTHCSGTLTIEDSEDASPIHTLSSGEAILHIIADDKRRSYNPGRRISSYLLQSTLIKKKTLPFHSFNPQATTTCDSPWQSPPRLQMEPECNWRKRKNNFVMHHVTVFCSTMDHM